jgi:molybdopterin/thiamine biosynthesis adenylyltransferase
MPGAHLSGDPRKAALVVGAGGLGAAAALALGSGGAARIVLADGSPVRAADLAAQPLLVRGDLGRTRAEASAAALARRFPALAIEAAGTLDEASAPALLAAVDVVIDASNRFPVMFLASDAAAAARRPLVHGAVTHWTAQLLTVVPGATGCLRCLFEAPPTGVAEAASPGPLAALTGALLGAEALRLLEGAPAAYAGKVFEYQARAARTRSVPLPRRAGCPACGGPAPAASAGGEP